RHPPPGRTTLHFKRLIERGLEPVRAGHAEIEPSEMTNRRDDDFGGERQRSDHDPRSDRAVVRAEGSAAGNVVEKLSLNTVDDSLHPARAVAGREPPTVLPIACELQRIADGVLLVQKGGMATVLEVVAAVLPHERVPDATEIDPQVRKLMGKQGTRVQ